MRPAAPPRSRSEQERLLVIDPDRDAFADFAITDLPDFLARGDTLVLNDAATLPASLRAGEDLELRLMSRLDDGSWLALSLGRGDYRVPTEERGTPPVLAVGTELAFGHGLSARVRAVDARSPRLLYIEFEQADGELWQALYRAARPIQYAYLRAPLALWDVQNAYSARPWAVELPSAGKPLRFEVLFRVAARGVQLAHLTHEAGLSSTGDAALDAHLPVSERYELSAENAARVRTTQAQGGRVIAVGTSVTRALEAASVSGKLRAGAGRTDLRLGPSSVLRVCAGLVTGIHEPGTSHFALLGAYARAPLLERSFRHAERAGYLQHEFGDSCLILNGSLAARSVGSGARRVPEWRQAG